MSRQILYNDRRNEETNDGRGVGRRAFLLAVLGVLCVVESGCATFGQFFGAKKGKEKEGADAEETETEFDVERKNQESLSDSVATAGRKGKEKREIPRGETFLLSDKAKEIYANTER